MPKAFGRMGIRLRSGAIAAALLVAMAGVSAQNSRAVQTADPFGQGHYISGFSFPVVEGTVKADYTPAARAAGIEGHVVVHLAITELGVVKMARVARSLDAEHGLDAAALAAAYRLRFSRPGRIGSREVAVIIPMTFTFRLREPGRLKESDPPAVAGDPFEEAFHFDAEGLMPPRPTLTPSASYTRRALDAGIQGTAVVEGIIDADGRVRTTRILTPLLAPDHGLNAEAERAARRWRFEPGRLDGRAVPVVATFEMSFTLH